MLDGSQLEKTNEARKLFSRGMKRMPAYVEKALSAPIKRELSQNGHGISFPDESGCQMRIIRDGKDRGGFYSYRQYGGIEKAVVAAMNRNKMIRLKYQMERNSTKDFCYYLVREDKRKGKTEWSYRVNYRKKGKAACKAFSMGHREPSTAKQMHAFLTAKLFRFYFEELGENFDERIFTRWKHCRLYLPGDVYFDWENG